MGTLEWILVCLIISLLGQFWLLVLLSIRRRLDAPVMQKAGAHPARVIHKYTAGLEHIDIGSVKTPIGNVDRSKVKSESSTINTNSDRLKKLKELKEGKK